jgi:hypothetical protein
MSRVEDDNPERRIQERLLLEKQLREAKAQRSRAEDSAFAKLVHQGKAEEGKKKDVGQQHQADVASGRDVIRQARTFGDRMRAKDGGDEALRDRLSDAGDSSGFVSERHGAGEMMAEVRSERREAYERLEERHEESEKNAEAHSALGKSARGGELRTTSEGGGGQQGGGGKNEGDGSAAAGQAFRLNPALMAPVAVATPRTGVMSDKLRALANEIAQKIVQSVRVGTNRAGEAEFQIDLKSSVLSGLQIKVSGKNGKISAAFSGSDKAVLKLLRDNADGLKQALSSRGLALVDLKIEDKA